MIEFLDSNWGYLVVIDGDTVGEICGESGYWWYRVFSRTWIPKHVPNLVWYDLRHAKRDIKGVYE